MVQDHKSIQEPKRDGRDDKHVHRCNGIGMVAKECLPTLRRWPPPLHHVLCHRALANIDAELEQLAVDAWRSPQWVGETHLANELANVRGRSWSAPERPRFPAPIGSEPSAMPTDDRLWLEDS